MTEEEMKATTLDWALDKPLPVKTVGDLLHYCDGVSEAVTIRIGNAYYYDNNQYEATAVDDAGNYYHVRWEMRGDVTDEEIANDESCACDWDVCDCIYDDDWGEVTVLEFARDNAIIIPRH